MIIVSVKIYVHQCRKGGNKVIIMSRNGESTRHSRFFPGQHRSKLHCLPNRHGRIQSARLLNLRILRKLRIRNVCRCEKVSGRTELFVIVPTPELGLRSPSFTLPTVVVHIMYESVLNIDLARSTSFGENDIGWTVAWM